MRPKEISKRKSWLIASIINLRNDQVQYYCLRRKKLRLISWEFHITAMSFSGKNKSHKKSAFTGIHSRWSNLLLACEIL